MYQLGTIVDMPTDTAAKRPRIDNSNFDAVETMHPGLPFERAVNRIIEEAVDARQMLAESVLDLEGPRPTGKAGDAWRARRDELVDRHNTAALMSILRLRLRDRGVEL